MTEDLRLESLLPKIEAPLVKEKCPYGHEAKERIPLDYKSVRKAAYFLLERPTSKFAVVYHFTSLLLIVGSLLVSVLSTIKELEDQLKSVMFLYEFFLLIWFSAEFALRLWSCSYISKYQGTRGRIRFLSSVYMMIDVFVILSTITTFIMQVNGSYFAILRITRFMQVFRILRIDRQRGDFRTMGNVVKIHSKELMTVYFVGFVIMFSATYCVYLCEKHAAALESITPDNLDPVDNSTTEATINNMANGLYWAVITVTSVGYGDFSPVTWTGKIFCAIFALIGCSFFSLPAGILGSGFALQVAKQKKEKRYVKVRNPAAYVIQIMWRNYAIRKENDQFEATWYHLLPQLKDDNENPQTLEMMMRAEIEKDSQHLTTMFPPVFSPSCFKGNKKNEQQKARVETAGGQYLKISGHKQHLHPHSSHHSNNNIHQLEEGFKKLGKMITRRNSDTGSESNFVLGKENLLMPQTTHRIDRRESAIGQMMNGAGRDKIHKQIYPKYKTALRFIMKLRYWNAIKLFKSVRHPFVNMQDIMEKNAMSHLEMLAQLKSMKDTLNLLQQEMLELRYVIIDLKQHRKSGDNDCSAKSGKSNPDLTSVQNVNNNRRASLL